MIQYILWRTQVISTGVSANLKTGVGAQVKGISEGVKANSDAGVSPSVNALDTGVKAAAAIGGLADG